MTAVVVHLSGLPAVLAVLVLCAVVCSPLYFASRWAGRWFTRHVLEPRLRRDASALGTPAEQVDRDWGAIKRGDWPGAD